LVVKFQRGVYAEQGRPKNGSSLALDAHPWPVRFGDLFIKPQCGHAQEFAWVHAIETGVRTSGSACATGETQIQVAAFRQNLPDLSIKVFRFLPPN